jgi:hypothetical protein
VTGGLFWRPFASAAGESAEPVIISRHDALAAGYNLVITGSAFHRADVEFRPDNDG